MGEVISDSIQIEIESNSTTASKGLDALAEALQKLKKNGSFKTVSTNLNNLSAALKSVSSINFDRVAPQIEKVADVVAPLSDTA